jgi:transposase InsO family protein
VDIHAEAARPSQDHAGDLVPHSAHGHRKFRVGLHADPGGAEEPGPWRGQEYGRQGPERQRAPARAGQAIILADVPAGPLGEIAGADFFTTEVWTPRGLITYYTLFVLDLRSRRVHVVGSTPTPDGGFMAQAARRLTDAVDGFLVGHRVLICDRDRKWTDDFRRIVQGAGVRIVLMPVRAPNANAYAERFVRSIREECLDRLILFGERRLLRALDEFVAHYHRERNHQGLGNELITPATAAPDGTRVWSCPGFVDGERLSIWSWTGTG